MNKTLFIMKEFKVWIDIFILERHKNQYFEVDHYIQVITFSKN